MAYRQAIRLKADINLYPGGKLKRWTGTAWVPALLKAYIGASWITTKPLKRWSSSAWLTVDTSGT